MIKKLLALLLCMSLLAVPAFATEDETVVPPANWAAPYLLEAESLELLDEASMPRLYDIVSEDDMLAATEIVRSKLALLGLPLSDVPTDTAVVFDQSRGSVLETLAMLAEDYEWGTEASGIDFLVELGIVKGDGLSLALERPCTLQEFYVLSARFVLACYDYAGAGSKGLLWKVTNEQNGAVLYLLGTYHVDMNNMYPLNAAIRAAMDASEKVYFELDMLDESGLAEFVALQFYPEGESLKDNISPALYADVVALFGSMGADEETVNSIKPWALSNTIDSLSYTDESTGVSLAVDMYLYLRAFVAAKEVGGIETFALQASVFDTLSPAYQEELLAHAVYSAYNNADEGSEPVEVDLSLLIAWQAGDLAGFNALMDKDAMLAEAEKYNDQLTFNLLTLRDPDMIESAAAFLQAPGSTTFLAVGSLHMVGTTGIVVALDDMGYTVEYLY